MTAYWRKLLGKICTLTFTVPAGTDVWRISQFEPLIVGLYLPLIRHYPWTLKGAPMLDRVERSLHSLPLTDHKWGGHILWQLLMESRALETMSASVVRELLCPP